MIDQKLSDLVQQIRQECLAKKITISAAESCTGGLLSACLTALDGASEYFGFGFVTYSNHAKTELLGISRQLLDEFGAVSKETVAEMALNCRRKANSSISVAISGIAGPGGGSKEKPVGTVCFGIATAREVKSYSFHFAGNRSEVRQQSCEKALELLLSGISSFPVQE